MAVQYGEGLAQDRRVSMGVADNFKGDRDVSAAFERAVETIRGLD